MEMFSGVTYQNTREVIHLFVGIHRKRTSPEFGECLTAAVDAIYQSKTRWTGALVAYFAT